MLRRIFVFIYEVLATIVGAAVPAAVAEVFRKKFRASEEAQPPTPAFERNDKGHIIISVCIGDREIKRIEAARLRVDCDARSCLNNEDYQMEHRRVVGRVYRVALVPVSSVWCEDRTLSNLQMLGARSGCQKRSHAWLIPSICLSISGKMMSEMGYGRIISPSPITISDRYRGNLAVVLGCSSSGRLRGYPADIKWPADTAVAFPV
ncbi:MAG: hypothetical protein WCW36_00540 [Candidatus Paceibacterota bacterium]|jgi:hypothetical protein